MNIETISVPLKSRGRTLGFAVVDACDAELVGQYNWRLRKTKRINYARVTAKNEAGEWRDIAMHRLIIGAREGEFVDHIDGNGLNNTRGNLRISTVAQNCQNKRKPDGEYTSKFKGVCKVANSKKWQANIWRDGKSVQLGRFSSELDAALAYDRAALQEFGPFARINFGQDMTPKAKRFIQKLFTNPCNTLTK